MSVFDLKGGSSGNGWNYSDNTKPNYMEFIEGTVVEISNPQSLNFATKQPEIWPDGNPKRNLCLVIKGRSGQELNWVFAPKSRGAEACLAALDPQNSRSQVSIEELLGKMIRVQTQAGVYNSQNPRPWWVMVLGDGDVASVRGLKDLSQQQSQAAPVPQAPPIQQQPQPMVSQAPAPQIQYAQQQAAQALGFQQASQVAQPQVDMSPAEQYYDQDIPF